LTVCYVRARHRRQKARQPADAHEHAECFCVVQGKLVAERIEEAGLFAQVSEGAGVWRLSLVPPEAAPSLLADAHTGDVEAQRLVTIMSALADKLFAIDAPRTEAACLLCDAQFWRGRYPRLLSVLNAEREDPDAALVCGVCSTCCAAHDANTLHDAIISALSTRFTLSLRRLPPFHAAGRA
jgi:hypothetical protein